MTADLTVWGLRNLLRDHRFGHADEAELENALAGILEGLGLTVQRQFRFDDRNRVDLVTELPGALRLGIEVKVGGQAAAVRRQVLRYARIEQLGAVLLVTTVYRHMIEVASVLQPAPAGSVSRYLLAGKPCAVALINRGAL